MSLLVVILAAAGCLSNEIAQPVRTGQMRSEEIRVETASGPVTAQAAERKTDVRFPRGKTDSGFLVGVYEPRSGLFWWQYEMGNPTSPNGAVDRLKTRSRFYLAESSLVSLVMNARFLDVRESKEHVSGLQDGMDKAAQSLNATLREIESGTKEWFTRIDLGSLGADFFLRRGNAASLDAAKITSVTFSGGKWDVTIEGPNDDTVIVTLDASYELLGTRRPD
jgi:hypothetical protein